VRGLDYYTRTVFEFESGALGAQAALGGGGRYDGLVELLGGAPTPGVGWAAGIERILMARREPAESPGEGVFVAVAKPERRADAFGVVRELREAGVAADMEHTERSLKGQLKQADRLGAHYTVILGDTTEVKDMRSGEQREVTDVLQAVGAS
jgi:histidyl-tRNA synthetase